MQNLKEQYSFSMIDYKTFHPNLLRNQDHIEFHQQIHRDLTIDPPIVVTKKKILNKLQKMKRKILSGKANQNLIIYGKKL